MRALITGGGGFLGGRIARMLHERGDEVTVFGRSAYAHMAALGIRCVQGDVRDGETVRRACAGIDAVFHAAALPGIWGPDDLYYQTNTVGTENVIRAAQACGVGRLIYTSSPSVVLGAAAVRGGNESLPYPGRYLAPYPRTKALAERKVLAASSGHLRTVAIRPHLIFGPGDPHLLPRIVARARRHRLVRIGNGENLVDITYIDNAAQAHVQAADELSSPGRCAGRAYFVSQGEPVKLWDWIGEVLARISAPPIRRRLSHRTARCAGACMEGLYRMLRIRAEPPMTRFLADQLAHDHYFDISAARRDFGYTPVVSTAEATDRLVEWLKALNL
ncbi:MAG: NAD-dependent epimerase/dehydratase family protein [Phycisphaerales bacterium]|nr:NAD-dependent epimerase/dehydratase family protein [Phycisphaerales bacterium]